MPSGIYPRTKKHRENISKALTGKKKSEGHKGNISKALEGNQYAKGHIVTEEAIQKMKGDRKESVTPSAQSYRARKIYEERHGEIPKGHILHHRNEDITDNRDENHKLYPSHEEHGRHHALKMGFGISIGVNR